MNPISNPFGSTRPDSLEWSILDYLRDELPGYCYDDNIDTPFARELLAPRPPAPGGMRPLAADFVACPPGPHHRAPQDFLIQCDRHTIPRSATRASCQSPSKRRALLF